MIKLQELKEETQNLVNWRRELHKIPELELQLPQTVKYLEEELKKLNIKYKKIVNNNAIVALIESGKEGPTIGIRADMDGLPISEQTRLDFASQNGNMHACGHDAHMAIVLGVAKYLNSHKDMFRGNVKLIFQPGEEYPGGAKLMIEDGVLENPKVDAILGLHSGYINPQVEPGKVGTKSGPVMASMDKFYIKVIGRGGHGAYPYKAVDTISVSAEIIGALNKIISREISSLESAVLSVTRIQGGYNQNILPENVEMEGTVRATNEDIRKYIAKRIKEISEGIAKSFNANAIVEYEYKYPVVENNKEVTEFFMDKAKEFFGEENVVDLKTPIMAAEDIAYFLKEVPGTFFFLSNPKDKLNPIPHHNAKFDIDEEKLYLGTALFVNSAIEYLNNYKN